MLGLVVVGCASTPPTPDEVLRSAAGELREAVTGAVDDPSRQARALALVDQLDHELSALARANQALEIQSGQLFADYLATKKDFEQLLGAAQTSRERTRKRLVDVRLALAALLTADEWHALTDADADIMRGWPPDAQRDQP